MKLYLFGAPRLENEGQPINIKRRKGLALLAYLVFEKEPQARDRIASLFWPSLDNAKARSALRATLPTLTKSLGKEYLLKDRKTIQLNLNQHFWVDVLAFNAQLIQCQKHHIRFTYPICERCRGELINALSLYKGDFLAGFHLKDCPDFTLWQNQQNENLRKQSIIAYKFLTNHEMNSENWEQAQAYVREWLSLDEYDEAAHRQLMILLNNSGQNKAIYQHYQQFVHTLETELGLSPHAETIALYERLNGRETSPSLITQSTKPLPPHNLPLSLTSFFGRKREIHEVTERLAKANCRLVTLSGPGGIGKSRLSIEVGRACHPTFEHGTYFVPLAPISSPDLIVSTIAEAINFQFYGKESSHNQLLNYLRKKEMFLILDNFDHLLEGAEFLLDILQTAPNVKMLVTSRECLNFQAEWLYEIEGLPYPKEGIALTQKFTAVQLFTERAQRMQTRFSLAKDQISCVAHICQLVEGMPLAIELAAPLVRNQSCSQIESMLTQSLENLKTTMADIPSRHRSMQAVIEQSWQQLPLEEQLLAQKLSIFRGGFTTKAAEVVARATLPLLTSLVDKSFIRMIGNRRYEMHEVLRKYLQTYKTIDENLYLYARENHCNFYAEFVSSRNLGLLKCQQKDIDAIANDIENIRTSWSFAAISKKRKFIKRMTMPLYLYFDMKSLFLDGADVFREAFSSLNESDIEENKQILGVLLSVEGRLFQRLSKLDKAKSLSMKSLTYLPENAKRDRAFTFQTLATVCRLEGSMSEALDYSEKGLSLAKLEKDLLRIASIQHEVGVIYRFLGVNDKAQKILEESLAISQKFSYRRIEAQVLNTLTGIMYYLAADYSKMQKLQQQSLSIFREIGDQHGVGMLLHNMGYITMNVGKQVKESVPYYIESLSISRHLGDRWGEAKNLQSLGEAYENMDQQEIAQNYLLECIQINRELGSQGEISLALGTLSTSYIATSNLNKAQESLVEAILVDLKTNNRNTLMTNIIRFAELCERRGESVCARHYLIAVKYTDECPEYLKPYIDELFHRFSYEPSKESEVNILTLKEIAKDIVGLSGVTSFPI